MARLLPPAAGGCSRLIKQKSSDRMICEVPDTSSRMGEHLRIPQPAGTVSHKRECIILNTEEADLYTQPEDRLLRGIDKAATGV